MLYAIFTNYDVLFSFLFSLMMKITIVIRDLIKEVSMMKEYTIKEENAEYAHSLKKGIHFMHAVRLLHIRGGLLLHMLHCIELN